LILDPADVAAPAQPAQRHLLGLQKLASIW